MPENTLSRPAPPPRGRLFLGVLLLNALLLFPVLFQTYKHYSERTAAWDVRAFMAIAEKGPAGELPPFRFRVLTALLVREMHPLPAYAIEVDFTTDPAVKRRFFHFIVLNGLFSILTSGVIFLYLLGKVRGAFAWAGSLMYLFSFFSVTCGFIPMADASSHLAIAAGVLCFERRRFGWFALACLAGAFAKETALIVLIGWVFVHSLRNRRNLAALLWTLPAVLVYAAVQRIFPGPLVYPYYQPSYMLSHLLAVFHPASHDADFLINLFLSQLPLLAAAAAWLYLRIRKAVLFPLDPGLLLFPVIMWMGLVMGLGPNTGRFVFMAFPAFMLFQAQMLQALHDNLSPGPPDGSPGAIRTG
jgi:hypothetical protein